MSLTVYYASDIHGSEVLWRKFVNAGRFYGADVLVMGGDIAGKAVVPIVQRNGGFVARQVTGDRSLGEDELPEVERRIRDMGFYPFRTTDEEFERTHGDPRPSRRSSAGDVGLARGAGSTSPASGWRGRTSGSTSCSATTTCPSWPT